MSQRLLTDLEEMVALWQPGGDITASILGAEPHDLIEAMLAGTVEFIQVELAGERMRLALTPNDPEEEHDCFSDQTHLSHYYNLDGAVSLLSGAYHPSPGLPEDVVATHARALPAKMGVPDLHVDPSAVQTSRASATEALEAMHEAAEAGRTFDTLIAADDPAGNQIVQWAISDLLLFSFFLQEMTR